MNIYHIHYFGLLADRRGMTQETVSHQAETPLSLYESLLGNHAPDLSQKDVRAAVNDEFVSWDHPLRDQDRIAFLPPMSGG
jgi:molybdopterin synthase sulfur carrier subunit